MKRNFIWLAVVTAIGAASWRLWERSPSGPTEFPAPDLPARELPLPGSDRLALASDGNAFALDLYKKLQAGGPGNIFFSPYSISSALAMTYAGAAGETARQMRAALRLSLPDEILHRAFAEQIAEANGPDKPYALTVANALWAQAGFPVKEGFTRLLEKTYGAGLSLVDFKKNPGAACEKVNAWVSEKTNRKIEKILDPNNIKETTRLVLTNAIYFKGSWAEQFEKKLTQDAPFYVAKDQTGTAPLMRRTGVYGYTEDAAVQALSMPYKGNELSMVVLLPKDKYGLAALERNLNKANLDLWMGTINPVEVDVEFPKFKLETDYDLGEDLKALGMPLAFTPLDPKDANKPHADFSGIVDPKDDELNIDFVLHKAFVDVNEEGTEAAAVTAVGMVGAAESVAPPTPHFRADHPFVFLIREDRTGAILFIGRLSQPG